METAFVDIVKLWYNCDQGQFYIARFLKHKPWCNWIILSLFGIIFGYRDVYVSLPFIGLITMVYVKTEQNKLSPKLGVDKIQRLWSKCSIHFFSNLCDYYSTSTSVVICDTGIRISCHLTSSRWYNVYRICSEAFYFKLVNRYESNYHRPF